MIRPSVAMVQMRDVPAELAAFLQSYFSGESIALRPPHAAVRFVDGLTTMVLYREGRYQVELVLIAPGTIIPEHVHPDVESYEVALAGELEFYVDGRQTGYPRTARRDGCSRDLGKYVPVPADAPHCGRAGAAGASFLSVQLWREGVAPSSVLINWQGETLGRMHDAARA